MKLNKLKKALAFIIAWVPLNVLRVLLYRLAFGYDIKNTKIALGTVIYVNHFNAESVLIESGNKFIGPISITLNPGARIAKNNLFRAGFWLTHEQQKHACLVLSKGANITSSHYFDLNGGIKIGKHSWIAGWGSQFWTHGGGKPPKGITIGDNCYVSSSVLLSPGVVIGEGSTIALGSVVTKSFADDVCLIGGNPARVVKNNYAWEQMKNG